MTTLERDTFTSGGRGASGSIAVINPASNGDTWTLQTTAASTFSFSGSQGSLTGNNGVNLFTLNSSAPNQWYSPIVSAKFTKTNTGDSCGVVGRFQNLNNYYHARVVNGNLVISRVLSGGASDLATVPFADGGAAYYIKLSCVGFGLNGTYNNLQAKAWLASGSEPSSYMVSASDATITQIGLVGIRCKGSTNSTTQTFSDFTATTAPAITPSPSYNVTQESQYGATVYFNGSNPALLSQQAITDLQAWGNGVYIREQIQAGTIETTQGNYNWDVLDDLVYRCNQAGIRICAGLQGFPSWYMTVIASTGAAVTAGTGELPDPTMFANFATLAATRYNGQNGYGYVEEWQIENELYDSTFASTGSGSGRDILGRRMAEVANVVYPAILAASGYATISFCAVRKTATNGLLHQTNWITNLCTYLTPSIQNFRQDTHYYRGGTFNLDPTTQSSDVPSIATVLANMANIFVTKGFFNVKLMVGEFGWDVYDDGSTTTPTTSWLNQYNYSKSMLDAGLPYPNCRMCIYTLNTQTVIDYTAVPPKANVSGSTKSIAMSLNSVYQYLPAWYLMQYYAKYMQAANSGTSANTSNAKALTLPGYSGALIMSTPNGGTLTMTPTIP